MGLASLSRGIHHRARLAESDPSQNNLAAVTHNAVVDLTLVCIRPGSPGMHPYGCTRLYLVLVQHQGLIVSSE
jgi:hypothetical protein